MKTKKVNWSTTQKLTFFGLIVTTIVSLLNWKIANDQLKITKEQLMANPKHCICLEGIRVSPPNFSRGEKINIEYKINNSCKKLFTLWLGAKIIFSNSLMHYKKEEDNVVKIPEGEHTVTRSLTVDVPDNWPAGNHTLTAEVFDGLRSYRDESTLVDQDDAEIQVR